MVITRGDIERHRMKFTYKMVITCEITALLSVEWPPHLHLHIFHISINIYLKPYTVFQLILYCKAVEYCLISFVVHNS